MFIRLSNKERKELITQIRVMAHPNLSFYILMLLSTLIAGYGLLANSTAVVIGAMLVAPLMGPIFGMTLGLVIGDRKLFFESLLAETTGVVLAILMGVLIGSMPFIPPYESEILSRTQPTLFDMIIALASGLAGGYVLVNPKLNSGIAGVAIATALVPPLAVCGLEIAAGGMQEAQLAFLLFISNVFAILLSAAVIFMLSGVERVHEPGASRLLHLLRTFGPGVVALSGLTFFLSLRLVDIVSLRQLEDNIRSITRSEVQQSVKGAELSVCEIRIQPEMIDVETVVLSWKVFDEVRVAQIEDTLERETGRAVTLIVRTYSTHDYDSHGKYYWDSDEEVREQQRLKAQLAAQELAGVSATLREYLKQVSGAFLKEVYEDAARENGKLAFTAEIESIKPLAPQQIMEMQQQLMAFMLESRGQETQVYLRVRQDNVRYMDAEGILFEQAASEPPPGYEETRELLYHALALRLAELQPGAILDDLQHRRGLDTRVHGAGGSGPLREVLIVQATIYSPALFSPQEISEVEGMLAEMVTVPVWLQFDNFIRAYIDSGGIQQGFTSSESPGS